MSVLEKVVYLTKEQFETLRTEGALTVDGKTIEYQVNDIYVVVDTEASLYRHNVSFTLTGTKKQRFNVDIFNQSNEAITSASVLVAKIKEAGRVKLGSTMLGQVLSDDETVDGYYGNLALYLYVNDSDELVFVTRYTLPPTDGLDEVTENQATFSESSITNIVDSVQAFQFSLGNSEEKGTEIDLSGYAKLNADAQTFTGLNTFNGPLTANAGSYFNAFSVFYDDTTVFGEFIQSDGTGLYGVISSWDGTIYYCYEESIENEEGESESAIIERSLYLPHTDGMLATRNDIPQLYKHTLVFEMDYGEFEEVSIICERAEPFYEPQQLVGHPISAASVVGGMVFIYTNGGDEFIYTRIFGTDITSGTVSNFEDTVTEVETKSVE